MRQTVVTLIATSMLVVASLVAIPSNAQSQVIIIVGNGSAQPYYPPYPYPYPHPYPHTHVVYGGGYYPEYGYPGYGYYNGYSNGYYGAAYSAPYGYGYGYGW